MPRTAAQIEAAQQAVTLGEAGTYSYLTNNCTTYATSVLRASGVAAPPTTPMASFVTTALQSPNVVQPVVAASVAQRGWTCLYRGSNRHVLSRPAPRGCRRYRAGPLATVHADPAKPGRFHAAGFAGGRYAVGSGYEPIPAAQVCRATEPGLGTIPRRQGHATFPGKLGVQPQRYPQDLPWIPRSP